MSATGPELSQMAREAAEAPRRAALQRERNRNALREAARRIRALDPPFAITIARGSSDHAASFAKHLFETRLGIPTVSQAPSLATLFKATSPRLKGTLALAISQSGRSPDLIETASAARAAGATVVAMVNDETSPLAREADILLPLHAGEERSIAATKSFIASLMAVADLVSALQTDEVLAKALDEIEAVLEKAYTCDWAAAIGPLSAIDRLLVLGRGCTLPIAGEAALKFKETCQLHAESYSSAEVLHGPVSIVDRGFPVIALCAADAAEASLASVADALADKGASVYATSAQVRGATALPTARTAHPLTDPISLIVSFYGMVEAVARARGIDPDSPRHLRKVTETV